MKVDEIEISDADHELDDDIQFKEDDSEEENSEEEDNGDGEDDATDDQHAEDDDYEDSDANSFDSNESSNAREMVRVANIAEKYGAIIAEKTGLKYHQVQDLVKYKKATSIHVKKNGERRILLSNRSAR